MNETELTDLQVRTAFACMAADGHISPAEVRVIESLLSALPAFEKVDINEKLVGLTREINEMGDLFLRNFLNNLKAAHLSEEQELSIIRIAVKVIQADEQTHYQEIKFFKLIRLALRVSDASILAELPEIEDYLEQDIIGSASIEKLSHGYFATLVLPKFEIGDKFQAGLSPDDTTEGEKV